MTLYQIEPNSERTPDAEQKIHLLRVAISKSIEIIKADLHDIKAILNEIECDVVGQDLRYSERLKACPHCCLEEEEKKKAAHLSYLENCLKTCK